MNARALCLLPGWLGFPHWRNLAPLAAEVLGGSQPAMGWWPVCLGCPELLLRPL